LIAVHAHAKNAGIAEAGSACTVLMKSRSCFHAGFTNTARFHIM